MYAGACPVGAGVRWRGRPAPCSFPVLQGAGPARTGPIGLWPLGRGGAGIMRFMRFAVAICDPSTDTGSRPNGRANDRDFLRHFASNPCVILRHDGSSDGTVWDNPDSS